VSPAKLLVSKRGVTSLSGTKLRVDVGCSSESGTSANATPHINRNRNTSKPARIVWPLMRIRNFALGDLEDYAPRRKYLRASRNVFDSPPVIQSNYPRPTRAIFGSDSDSAAIEAARRINDLHRPG